VLGGVGLWVFGWRLVGVRGRGGGVGWGGFFFLGVGWGVVGGVVWGFGGLFFLQFCSTPVLLIPSCLHLCNAPPPFPRLSLVLYSFFPSPRGKKLSPFFTPE